MALEHILGILRENTKKMTEPGRAREAQRAKELAEREAERRQVLRSLIQGTSKVNWKRRYA
ncbi:MAG: hypothetical protein PHH17_01180 [Candidatus Pacebacteria bacterium]|jgi:hypothetical protein|nr:hypothetical protein [Candidatus Paceibacterota bacterium]MDD3072613.1 hypothetical protein [Candidatus Paceibacterota bacterium]MDD3728939.1 hypothetical protein [Candidatus Paceibacterota bacterium]MDD4201555.1 hypothetical protein [Candidatus Paceibacterota bacterium]MDD4467406.1 hypothetical protein [Candidatus Paceibacterota bacterium]